MKQYNNFILLKDFNLQIVTISLNINIAQNNCFFNNLDNKNTYLCTYTFDFLGIRSFFFISSILTIYVNYKNI